MGRYRGLKKHSRPPVFGIDLRQVWETAELDMPILKAKVREILQEIDDK